MQANEVCAITKYVAGKITSLRTERGLSQLDAAVNCDMFPNQFGQMERGKVNVKINTLCRVVNSFNISMAEFFKDFEGEKSS